MDKVIDSFTGEWACLSNFWSTNVCGYPSAEHYLQANKTLDLAQREAFKDPSVTPGKAKRMGRSLELRPDWELVKIAVMAVAVFVKFQPGSYCGLTLMDSYPAHLVEGNYWHDNFWGNCTCARCSNILGLNHLGILLETRRSELLAMSEPTCPL